MPRDPMKRLASRLAYRQRRREELAAKQRAYRVEHREERIAYDRAWHETHREAVRLYWQEYNQTHKAERRARAQANREYYLLHAQKRRARKAKTPRNDLTLQQWQAIKSHYGHRCVYCGKASQRLTMDHLTPLSKGGAHTYTNVVPACRSCNYRKHTGPPLKPVQPLLLL